MKYTIAVFLLLAAVNAGATSPDSGGVWQTTQHYCAPAVDRFFTAPYFKTSAVPVSAAVWLFASGLGLLGWFRRRQSA